MAFVTSNSNSSGGAPPAIEPQSCYFNYVTVFAWENSDKNAYEVTPVASLQKMGTLKVHNGSSVNSATLKSTLDYAGSAEWKYYFVLNTDAAKGTSNLTSYLNKFNVNDSSSELTCAFGPTFDANYNIADPTARIIYQNVGVGLNSIDGQVGFLSHKDKYIACKISKSSKAVVLHGSDGVIITNQAFIIKRGCYQ